MNTGKFFLMGTLFMGVAVLSSCSKDDIDMDEVNNEQAVSFSANIGGNVANTRASGTTWDTNDSIGVFMVNTGMSTIVDGTFNRKYTTPLGNGNFAAATENDTIYYPSSGVAVDFIAYYPYNSGWAFQMNPISLPEVQTTADQLGIDLLWAKATGYVSGSPALTFTHSMSKIVLNTTSKTEANLEGMVITIKGICIKGQFDMKTGVIGTTTTFGSTVLRTVTDGSKYDAIIIPGLNNLDAVTVEFAIGDKTYTWTVGGVNEMYGPNFAAGREYIYNVLINDTGTVPEQEAVTATGSITAWTSSTTSVETDE